MRPAVPDPERQLPWGWRAALPIERCENHPDRPAAFRYLGRPLCSECSRGFTARHAPEEAAEGVW